MLEISRGLTQIIRILVYIILRNYKRMSGNDSDSSESSVTSKQRPKTGRNYVPTTKTPEEIRETKLKNLTIARQKAQETLKQKAAIKSNEKQIKERERLVKLEEQEQKKKDLDKKAKKLTKPKKKVVVVDESSSESESESEEDEPIVVVKKKKKTKKVIKKQKYKGRQLEVDSSSSESESDSDDEEVLKEKIVKKRAKKTRDTVLKKDLEDQLDREYWDHLSKAVSGRL